MSAFIVLTTGLAIWVGFSAGSEVKNLPAMWETRIQSLGQEDPLEKGMVCPLQYSCLENSMNRGGWRASPWDQELDTTERLTFIFNFWMILPAVWGLTLLSPWFPPFQQVGNLAGLLFNSQLARSPCPAKPLRTYFTFLRRGKLEDEPPRTAQILVMKQQCWKGSPWGGRGQGGGLVGAPAGEKHWAGRGKPRSQVWLCPIWPRTRSPPGEPPLLWQEGPWNIAPNSSKLWRSEIHSSTKTSLSWGDFMASVLSVHPTLSYSCVLTEMDRWRACLGHLQREDPWPFCGHISAHQEGKDAPLQAPFGSLAWSAVFSASAPWRCLGTQCPHTSRWRTFHTLIPHNVWKLGLQTTLSCPLEITNW